MDREEELRNYRSILKFPKKRVRGVKERKTPRTRLLIQLLLTGKVVDRCSLFDAFVDAFPDGSLLYNFRLLEQSLPLFDDLGLLERVGRYSFRIKPSLLPLLREDNPCLK